MKFYKVISNTGEEICMVARTLDHAALAFIAVWIGRTGTYPGAFSISMGSPEAYDGDPQAETIRLGEETGMLVRYSDGVMHFESAFGGHHG